MNGKFKDEISKAIGRLRLAYGAKGVIDVLAPELERATADVRQLGLEVPDADIDAKPASGDDDRQALLDDIRGYQGKVERLKAESDQLSQMLSLAEKRAADLEGKLESVRRERESMMASFGLAMADITRISKATTVEVAHGLARTILERFTPTQHAILGDAAKRAQQTLSEISEISRH